MLPKSTAMQLPAGAWTWTWAFTKCGLRDQQQASPQVFVSVELIPREKVTDASKLLEGTKKNPTNEAIKPAGNQPFRHFEKNRKIERKFKHKKSKLAVSVAKEEVERKGLGEKRK
jgi:hypothetical protein